MWVAGLIFAATVLVCPFDGAIAMPLGEMSTEAYALITILSAPVVLFLMVSTKAFKLPKDLTLIFILIMTTIFLSMAINMSMILGAEAKGRHGLEKLISSSLVPVLGMYVSLLTYNVVPQNFRRYFLKPLLIGSFIVAAVGTLQVAAIYISPLRGLSDRIYILTHVAIGDNRAALIESIGAASRVTSVLFEPADFGTYVVYVTPWLLAAWWSREGGHGGGTIPVVLKKLMIMGILIGLFGSILFSGRTAAIGTPAVVVAYVGLCLLATLSFNRVLNKVTCLIVAIGAVAVYVLPVLLVLIFKDEAVSAVVATGSNSNISRFGTAVIMLDLFRDNPFFGVGMGQYGFYVAKYVPYWAYTYEFRAWLGDLRASFFPSFAVFARLGGELGLVGLVTWVCFLAVLLYRVFRNLRVAYFQNGQFPYFGVAVAANFFSLGLTGMGMASFRVFWLWTLIGLASIYAWNPQLIDSRRPAK
jgi:hypothetical protein